MVLKVKTGEHDRVFGSVSPKQIITELKNKGFDIAPFIHIINKTK